MNTNNHGITLRNGIVFLFLYFAVHAHAQHKEANNWYFGNYVGMTWNTTQTIGGLSGLPTPLPPSDMIDQTEGVFGMSDVTNGNLLFYSDGMTIWNNQNDTMPNGAGLTGHNSSAQSGIVIPYPGKINQYIAFTLGQFSSGTLAYSVIDMTLDGGLGDVVASQKNISLTGAKGGLGESVAAVKHANGIDYWVVAVGKGSLPDSSALNVWKVTSAGVQTVCFASQHLPQSTPTGNNRVSGYLRFSADGKYFAWPQYAGITTSTSGNMNFGTFDPATGSFPVIKLVDIGFNGYGIEFSTSNEILYTVNHVSRNVYAYKFADLLAAMDPNTVSRRMVPTGVASSTTYPLQMGPDERIYGTITDSTLMYVIDNVDDYDNFTIHLVDGLLPKGPGYEARIGLPNFMAYFFAPIEATCTYFTDDLWYFGTRGGGIAFNDDGNGGKTAVSASGESQVNSYENSLSVSSPGCGSSLIFYASHNQLYNAKHEPMLDGSFAGGDSVADGMGACYIGNNQYMIFSVDHGYESGLPMALQYHIIDMNADDGYGQRIFTGTIEPSGMSESIQLIPVPGTADEYWLVYNMFPLNEIRVRKITGNSVSTTYTSLPMSAYITDGRSYQFKSNRTYNMLAIAYDNGTLASRGLGLFDLDVNTGIISPVMTPTLPNPPITPYGVEFSPNGNYVYVTGDLNPRKIIQYNISAKTFSPSLSYGEQSGGGLKVGPDGRLYLRRQGRYMGLISNPDAPLNGSGLTVDGFDLGAGVNTGGLVFSTGLTPPAICPVGPNEAPIAENDFAQLCTGDFSACVPVLLNDHDPNPGDSFSLVNVFFQNEADSSRVSFSFNPGDSVICVTAKPGAQKGDIIALQYTVRDDANPIHLCNDGTLEIEIIECPDNISDADCFILPPAVEWSITETRSIGNNFSPYQVAMVGDVDDDGIPEILVCMDPVEGTVNTISRPSSKIAIFKGNDISTPWKTVTTVQPYVWNHITKYGIVKTKISGIDTVLIVVAESDRLLRAYNYNGGLVWTSNVVYHSTNSTTGYDSTAPGFADLNGDGIPEVMVKGKIFNSVNGQLLGAATPDPPFTFCVPIAADLFNTGTLNFIVGNRIYTPDASLTSLTLNQTVTLTVNPADPDAAAVTAAVGTPRAPFNSTAATTNSGGLVSAVDMDNDGKLELIYQVHRTGVAEPYVGEALIAVVDPETGNIKASKYIPYAPQCSWPFVGDIDGDGFPEIVFITSRRNVAPPNAAEQPYWNMHAYKYVSGNPLLQQFWTYPHQDASGVTGMTVFDFNQDGIFEIVYRDEQNIRIINGSLKDHITGLPVAAPYNLSDFPNTSGTSAEYPVVADVDNDGQAEIVMVGGDPPARAVLGSLRVYKSGNPATSPWAPARKVWNQYAYNAVNVNEDLTVPEYQMNPATVFPGLDGVLGNADDTRPFNAFLQQQTTLSTGGTPLWLAPDVVANPSLIQTTVNGSAVTVTIGIVNEGDAGIGSPVYVSLYRKTSPQTFDSGTLIATDSAAILLLPDSTATVTVHLPDSFPPGGDMLVRLNDKGGAFPYQTECDTTDNVWDVPPVYGKFYRQLLRCLPPEIDVLAMHKYVCDRSDLSIKVIQQPSHATAISGLNAAKNLLFIPDAGFEGLDSVRFAVICNGDTVNRILLFVKVVECPDNISDADCFGVPDSFEFTLQENRRMTGGAHVKNTPLVGDLDGDSIPEIVTFNSNNDYDRFQFINVFDGATGALKKQLTLPASMNNDGWLTTSPAVLVDADRNGKGEIIFAGVDRGLYSYEATGSGSTFDLVSKWTGVTFTFPVGAGPTRALPQPVVTDFNGDGTPELVVYNQIFNAVTGASLGTTEAIASAYMGRNPSYRTNPGCTFVATADMDNDGLPELVAGGAVYKVNITSGGTAANGVLLSKNTSIGDGFTGVVDIDLDGALEVVVVKTDSINSFMFVWRPDIAGGGAGTFKSYTVTNASGGATSNHSFPFIGDIDGAVHPVTGQKYPEVCIMTINAVTSLHYDPITDTHSQLWKITSTDGSGGTGITLFDFNNDGAQELVYRDERNLRILDGTNGSDKATPSPCASGTAWEYPVIADVNGSGSASICVSCYNAGALTSTTAISHDLVIFNSNSEPWAPARRVWNQIAYNIVNIHEELTVPEYAVSPATVFPGGDNVLNTADDVRPFNGLLVQQTMLNSNGTPLWLMPDVYTDPSLVQTVLTGNSLTVTVGIVNQGDAAIGSPVYATLYRESLPQTFNVADTIAVGSVDTLLMPGDTAEIVIQISDITQFFPMAGIVIRLNDDGITFPHQPECDETNDTLSIPNPAIALMMKKRATLNGMQFGGTYPNPVSVLFGDTVEYAITAVNASTVSGQNIVIVDTLPPYLEYAGNASHSATVSNLTALAPPRERIAWTAVVLPNLAPLDSVTVTFRATPVSGAVASQPLFINRAWVSILSSNITVPTNSTYHQGAGVAVVTFSASIGGWIFNAGEQALDYRTSPRPGIQVIPGEGYEFAGWSHDAYTSLRGEIIPADSGVMNYENIVIYGNVELRANFVPSSRSRDTGTVENEDVPGQKTDKVWAVDDNLYVTPLKAGSVLKIYTVEGVLREQHTLVTAGTSAYKLQRGIYVVTVNNGAGRKIVVSR